MLSLLDLTITLSITTVSAGHSCLNLKSDCGATGTNSSVDDAPAFIVCQEKLRLESGGCVYVPAGVYQVSMVPFNTSHVHWNFDEGALFLPHATLVGGGMFAVGGGTGTQGSEALTNISLMGSASRPFIIDNSVPLSCPWNVRGIQINAVTNFTIANVYIRLGDNVTNPALPCPGTKSALGFDKGEGGESATNGLVANITSVGGHPGYGLMQLQTGENLHFENLDGGGGVTLRMETGGDSGYVNNITAKNITCRNGRKAFMAQPHQQHNGVFHVQDVYSYGCYQTVSVESGYADKGFPAGTRIMAQMLRQSVNQHSTASGHFILILAKRVVLGLGTLCTLGQRQSQTFSPTGFRETLIDPNARRHSPTRSWSVCVPSIPQLMLFNVLFRILTIQHHN